MPNKDIEARLFTDDKTGESYVAVACPLNALWFGPAISLANKFFKTKKESLSVGRGYLYRSKLYFSRDMDTGEVLFYPGVANVMVAVKKKKGGKK